MRRTCFAIMLVVLVAGVAIVAIPQEAEGQGTFIPVVSAAFDDSSKNADVTPGGSGNGIVKNTGTITCDSGSQTQVSASLTISAGGWGAAITPSSMTFPAGTSTRTFSITVRAPPGTSHKISQNIVVGGSWTGAEGLVGDVDQTSMIVFIDQYFKLILESDNPLTEIAPGDDLVFSMKIWNMGNDEDDFVIEIMNQKSLTDDGWTIPTVPKQTIEEKGVRPFKIQLTSPQDWTIWKNKVSALNVKVYSDKSRLTNPDAEVSMFYSLYVRQKGVYLPAYDPLIMVSGIAVAMLIFSRRRVEDL